MYSNLGTFRGNLISSLLDFVQALVYLFHRSVHLFKGEPSVPDSLWPVNVLHSNVFEHSSCLIVVMIPSVTKSMYIRKETTGNVHKGVRVEGPNKIAVLVMLRGISPLLHGVFGKVSKVEALNIELRREKETTLNVVTHHL